MTTHPYYPAGLRIEGGYVPNERSIPTILSYFVAWLGGSILVFLAVARRVNPGLSGADQLAFCWFILCGLLHCFFEGFWINHHEGIATSQALFAQLWKEYALSDSRYLVSDPFMLCIETLTVYLWGPLSFLTAICIITRDRGIQGVRVVLQIIVSVGHLYGVALYFGTCYFMERYAGVSYNRPEPLYYWVYYFGLNILWAVVPSLLLFWSARRVCLPYQLDAAPKPVGKRTKEL